MRIKCLVQLRFLASREEGPAGPGKIPIARSAPPASMAVSFEVAGVTMQRTTEMY